MLEKMLEKGVGIAIIPESIVKQYPGFPAKTVKIKRPEIKWKVGISWLKDRYMNDAFKRFKTFMLDYYKITEG